MVREIAQTPGGSPFSSLVQALQARLTAVVPGFSPPARGTLLEVKISTLLKVTDMTPLQTHDVVTEGLPVVLARDLMDAYDVVERDALLKAIGVSERTLVRGRDETKLLDTNAADRLIRLASITEQAIDVLGTKEAAERWLITPAIGLDQRRPIDLLQSSEGADLVRTLLTRMDYGVYS